MQTFCFFEEHFGVERDTVANDAGLVRVQDSGRYQVEDETLAVEYDRVPGVGTTRETNNQIELSSKGVDDFALTLVTPLQTYYAFRRQVHASRKGSVAQSN